MKKKKKGESFKCSLPKLTPLPEGFVPTLCDNWLEIAAAAKILLICERKFNFWKKNGIVPFADLGGRHKYNKTEMLHLLSRIYYGKATMPPAQLPTN